VINGSRGTGQQAPVSGMERFDVGDSRYSQFAASFSGVESKLSSLEPQCFCPAFVFLNATSSVV